MQTLVGSGKTVKKLLLPPSLYIALITIARIDLIVHQVQYYWMECLLDLLGDNWMKVRIEHVTNFGDYNLSQRK